MAAVAARARRPDPNRRMMSRVYKRSVQAAEIAAQPAATGVVHAGGGGVRLPCEGSTIVVNPAAAADAARSLRSRVPTSVPDVMFSDQRLDNGLRVIVAEDHLAPVVAVNLWYDVGSKHEVEGKTGFAHLFEHVMFQGSRHVAKAEHIALVQAAGGTMNGSTWLDRTNYFETLPAHQVDLALWLEADRMATLLDALSQENLDNQREVVKNEKRWSYDNRPYGSFQEKLQGHLFPAGHPYHHSTIGSMDDLDAASLEDVSEFFRTYYAPNNAVLSVVGDVDADHVRAAAERFFGAIPANPNIPPLGDLSLPATLGEERRETVFDRVPLPRVHVGFRAPVFGDTAARRARPGRPDPVGRQGQPAQPAPRPRRADRPGRRAVHARVHRRRVGHRRLGDGPAGHPGGARRGRPDRGARAPDDRAGER